MFPSYTEQSKTSHFRSRVGPAPEMPRRSLSVNRTEPNAAGASDSVNLYQPQDGAAPQRSKVTDIASRLLKLPTGEPEDARLTGGTRSLMRRLSGLNLVQQARPAVSRMAFKSRSVKAQQIPGANVA